MEGNNIKIKTYHPVAKASKILSIVAFSLILSLLVFAIAMDFVIFLEAIKNFFGGLIVSILLFIICFAGMILSICFIFGVYIIQENGFWPLNISVNFFKEALGDVEISSQQIATFQIIRVTIVILCVLVIAASIVALIMHKKEKKKGHDVYKAVMPFSIVSIVLAILGLFVALALLLIVGSI